MLHTLELGSDIICYTHLDESHFWCFHIIQDFYKIICDPPLTIKSYAGDFEQQGHESEEESWRKTRKEK